MKEGILFIIERYYAPKNFNLILFKVKKRKKLGNDNFHLFISAPICQNAFPSRLVKNEFRVFSESLGSPPSSTQTLVAIAGL